MRGAPVGCGAGAGAGAGAVAWPVSVLAEKLGRMKLKRLRRSVESAPGKVCTGDSGLGSSQVRNSASLAGRERGSWTLVAVKPSGT